MVDKEKVIVILLIIAILFSVVSTVLSLSLAGYKQVSGGPKVIYSGDFAQGNPNGGFRVYIQPSAGGAP